MVLKVEQRRLLREFIDDHRSAFISHVAADRTRDKDPHSEAAARERLAAATDVEDILARLGAE